MVVSLTVTQRCVATTIQYKRMIKHFRRGRLFRGVTLFWRSVVLVGVWRHFAIAQFTELSEPLRSRQAKSRGARTVLEQIWRRSVSKREASRFETETSSITLQRAYQCVKGLGLSMKARAYPFGGHALPRLHAKTRKGRQA